MTAAKVVAVLVIVVAIAAGALVAGGRSELERGEPSSGGEMPDRAAAVRAATRFLVGLDADTLLDRQARHRFIGRWASAEAEPQLQQVYDAEAKRVAVLDGGYARAAPLGYRVERLAASSADIAIWAVSLASVSDIPTAVGWRTLLVGLVREKGKWRIATVSDAPGPSPESRPSPFRAHAKRFREYRVVP